MNSSNGRVLKWKIVEDSVESLVWLISKSCKFGAEGVEENYQEGRVPLRQYRYDLSTYIKLYHTYLYRKFFFKKSILDTGLTCNLTGTWPIVSAK